MSATELQHYVPRFLLRKFGLGKKDRVHVFDKQKDCAFVSNAKAVAAENGFYDFEFMGTPMALEPSLSKLESNAAQHLAQIEESHRLPEPLSEARIQLACFLAVQMVRTRARLNTFNDIGQRMETWLRAQGMNEEYFAPDPKIGDGENARKALLARQITNAPKDFAPSLLEKDWLLLQTTRQHPFIIGDSPLAMFNSVDRGPRGNLGLDVEGIELYLPINPQLTLGLVCPTLTEAALSGTHAYRICRMYARASAVRLPAPATFSMLLSAEFHSPVRRRTSSSTTRCKSSKPSASYSRCPTTFVWPAI